MQQIHCIQSISHSSHTEGVGWIETASDVAAESFGIHYQGSDETTELRAEEVIGSEEYYTQHDDSYVLMLQLSGKESHQPSKYTGQCCNEDSQEKEYQYLGQKYLILEFILL